MQIFLFHFLTCSLLCLCCVYAFDNGSGSEEEKDEDKKNDELVQKQVKSLQQKLQAWTGDGGRAQQRGAEEKMPILHDDARGDQQTEEMTQPLCQYGAYGETQKIQQTAADQLTLAPMEHPKYYDRQDSNTSSRRTISNSRKNYQKSKSDLPSQQRRLEYVLDNSSSRRSEFRRSGRRYTLPSSSSSSSRCHSLYGAREQLQLQPIKVCNQTDVHDNTKKPMCRLVGNIQRHSRAQTLDDLQKLQNEMSAISENTSEEMHRTMLDKANALRQVSGAPVEPVRPKQITPLRRLSRKIKPEPTMWKKNLAKMFSSKMPVVENYVENRDFQRDYHGYFGEEVDLYDQQSLNERVVGGDQQKATERTSAAVPDETPAAVPDETTPAAENENSRSINHEHDPMGVWRVNAHDQQQQSAMDENHSDTDSDQADSQNSSSSWWWPTHFLFSSSAAAQQRHNADTSHHSRSDQQHGDIGEDSAGQYDIRSAGQHHDEVDQIFAEPMEQNAGQYQQQQQQQQTIVEGEEHPLQAEGNFDDEDEALRMAMKQSLEEAEREKWEEQEQLRIAMERSVLDEKQRRRQRKKNRNKSDQPSSSSHQQHRSAADSDDDPAIQKALRDSLKDFR